jgi:hypothetical protein
VPAPSTLLARALAIVEHVLAAEPGRQEELVNIADNERTRHEAVWELDTDDLYATVKLDPDDVTADDPNAVARWIGILDAWHRFANPGTPDFADGLSPAAALRAEGRLERDGRFNDDAEAEHGHLIPATCADSTGAAYVPRTPLAAEYEEYLNAYAAGGRTAQHYDHLPGKSASIGANRLLKNTTWLPHSVACGHPDGTSRPLREVATGYVQVGGLYKSNPLPLDVRLRVAVAPLAETRACIEIVVTDAGSRYLVAPAFSIERVKASILQAFSSGVHVLLFPEMTIDSRWLRDLADTTRKARRDQRRSALRYIILGVTRAPFDGIVGENFVAVIDGVGTLISSHDQSSIVHQDKISRWNLGKRDQRRFGFDRDRSPGAPLASLVIESIKEASTVFVFDILGFGRLVCLICASLEHNQPADWLVQHAQPDWVYAPVMDSSTCWTGCKASPLEKWTVKRAVRAACLSRGKVVVSNSMALQDFENEELSYANNPDQTLKSDRSHPPNFYPGVALMIDGSGEKLQYQILRANIPNEVDSNSPILVIADWNNRWSPLPRSIE